MRDFFLSMPTKKRRIPVTLPKDLELSLEKFAKAHDLSLSQSMVLLLREAEEWLEDKYFSELADSFDENQTFISHEEFWAQFDDEEK